MRPLSYSRTWAEVAFYALVAIFVVLEQRIRLRGLLNREGERLDRGSLFAVAISIGAGIAGAFVFASDVPGAAVTGGARVPLFIVGLGLMVVGIALRQWSIWLLGRFFTFDVRLQAGQPVVDRGPYAWVRHPSYTGLLIICLGIGLALTNGLSIACALLVPLPGTIVRIHVEERALREGLGEPYRRYAAGRARLVPRVW